MASNIFGRLATSSRGTRSFYEQLRSRDDDGSEEDIEQRAGLNIDDENLRQHLDELDTDNLGNSRLTVTSAMPAAEQKDTSARPLSPVSRWKAHDEDMDNDVPASLLVEHNSHEPRVDPRYANTSRRTQHRNRLAPTSPPAGRRAQWEATTEQQPLHGVAHNQAVDTQPRSLLSGRAPAGAKEKALWRWVNTSNIDSFMRDVYDYFEGGGLWCILTSNALWLL